MARPELHIFYWTKDGQWHPCLRYRDFEHRYIASPEDFMGPGHYDIRFCVEQLRRLFPEIEDIKIGRKQGPPERGDDGYE